MDSPKAMQNNSTGMLATRVPVDVVPNAPRWPSWKIHTIAPNAADSDRTLSASDLSGSTTLPVSRNSSTSVMTRDQSEHQRQPGGDGVHGVAVVCAVPVNSTVAAAGCGHRVQ